MIKREEILNLHSWLETASTDLEPIGQMKYLDAGITLFWAIYVNDVPIKSLDEVE